MGEIAGVWPKIWQLRGERLASTRLAVVAYGLTSMACFWARIGLPIRREAIWSVLAILFLLLALDRYLGMLSRFCIFVRSGLREKGWYWPWRRWIQAALICLVAILLTLAVTLPIRMLDLHDGPRRLAALAAGWCVFFVVLRAISLHEVDQLLYHPYAALARIRLNLLVELAGLAAVCWLALSGRA